MDIVLIRHGMTEGNKIRKFIGGRTDEPICADGEASLKTRRYQEVDRVFTSPMLRCTQTSRLIYPMQEIHRKEGLRECDFGILEGKTHQELIGNERYERFLKGNGTLPYPGGEHILTFHQRCALAFLEVIEDAKKEEIKRIACVVHGGTIMALLGQMVTESAYYDWRVENGEGYAFSIDIEQWRKKNYDTALTGHIDHRIYT